MGVGSGRNSQLTKLHFKKYSDREDAKKKAIKRGNNLTTM